MPSGRARSTEVSSPAGARAAGSTTATPRSNCRSTAASETWRCSVDDYSEFPTTPTGWQERQLADWQEIQPLTTEDPAHPAPRRLDLTALIPGVIFTVLAIVLMAGVDIPVVVFRDGGILWVLLIGVGAAMLVGELRKSRHRR